MSEAEAIQRLDTPNTERTLLRDFQAIGLESGMTVLVHSSLSRIGWVCGGAHAVIETLLAAIGLTGTLVMPAQSADLSDPASWSDPPVPKTWHPTIRATMPAYDPLKTPTRGMGTIAEQFRTWPGTRRSPHPSMSFTAHGPNAETILFPHPLQDPFGNTSPLARLYDLDAAILMIGTTFESCTALHLAERRAWPNAPMDQTGAPILCNGQRSWVEYEMPETDITRFPPLEPMLETLGTRTGRIGAAKTRLIPLRALIDAATQFWTQ